MNSDVGILYLMHHKKNQPFSAPEDKQNPNSVPKQASSEQKQDQKLPHPITVCTVASIEQRSSLRTDRRSQVKQNKSKKSYSPNRKTKQGTSIESMVSKIR